jgi:hypothetical protein
MSQLMKHWLVALGVLTLACGKSTKGSSPATSATPTPPSVAAAASVAPSPHASTGPATPVPFCRALRVTGEAKIGDVALAPGAELDGSAWVSLSQGASLTLKHSASGRELGVAGPALFRACRRGREQLLLAKGKVVGGSGMGARPGAEVSIATPVAAIRYGDAELTVSLDDKQLSVAVQSGQVEIDSASEKELKSPLRAKERLVVPLGKPDAAQLMKRCQEAAELAQTTARRVGDPTATEPLGERAQANVRARKLARSACTVAAAATGLVADPELSAGLWADAARWEGLWEMVPRRSRAQAPEK